MWTYTTTPPYVFMAWCRYRGTALPLNIESVGMYVLYMYAEFHMLAFSNIVRIKRKGKHRFHKAEMLLYTQ
jgi:hypothetical protein